MESEVKKEPGQVDSAVPKRFGMVGSSPAMEDMFDLIDRVADTPSTVLIHGESGTGKELVARALHEHSIRKDEPFIRINCAAIPKELVESELFGHERGAFTGAVSSKPGRFELANNGTLFLDEVSEIPLEIPKMRSGQLPESPPGALRGDVGPDRRVTRRAGSLSRER